MLNPDFTLEEANLQDGQSLLLEVSLGDGTWPRSQMQAELVARHELSLSINEQQSLSRQRRLAASTNPAAPR